MGAKLRNERPIGLKRSASFKEFEELLKTSIGSVMIMIAVPSNFPLVSLQDAYL